MKKRPGLQGVSYYWIITKLDFFHNINELINSYLLHSQSNLSK